MALRAHLVELRNRVIICAIALVITAAIGWYFYPTVFGWLIAPLEEASRTDERIATINYSKLTSAFNQQLTVALWLGVILSSPMWIYQLWAFITPGLTKRERWYAVGFLFAAIPLFLGGVALAWAVVPNAIVFLVSFAEAGSSTILTSEDYLSFVTRTLLAFGVAFLTPVVMVALTLAGLVESRTWLKGWRVAVLLAFVFAAVASPTPDPLVMFALALPMVGLYMLAVAVTWFIDRRRHKTLAGLGLADLDDDESSPLDERAAPIHDDAPDDLDDLLQPSRAHTDAT